MRIVIFGLIILASGLIGYEFKKKYIEQKEILEFFKNLFEYIYLNISVYKNNISEIINNYLIQQNNKNAKYFKIFLKKDNLYEFDKKIIDTYIYNQDAKLTVNSYIDMLGSENIESECVKLKGVLSCVESYLKITSNELRQKGDLWFKICLVVGVVVVMYLIRK